MIASMLTHINFEFLLKSQPKPQIIIRIRGFIIIPDVVLVLFSKAS